MAQDKKWTVYVLTTPNNKVYVGVTSGQLRKRWKYGHGYSDNTEFFSDITKYGWNSVKREIVSVFDNADDAYTLEKYLINQYNSTDPVFGYNKATGGKGAWGVKISDETRRRLIDSHTGKKIPHTPEWNQNIKIALKKRYETYPKPVPPFKGRSVLQYSRSGDFIKEYPSAKEAQRQTNIQNQNISRCCRGERRTAGGYVWKFKEQKENK